MNPKFKFALREDLVGNEINFLPVRAEEYSTGYDCKAAMPNRQAIVLKHGDYFKIPLGFRCIPEPGWYYQLHPRSSTMFKKNMHCLIGIIDESFPLEVMALGQYIAPNNDETIVKTIEFGDPICQIIPMKRENIEIDSISNEDFDKLLVKRNYSRTGGIGSTG